MSNDKIIAAWNRMNPDSSTKEKILQQLQETMKTNRKSSFTRKFRRFAVGFAAAVILLLGSFGTVYAASPAFREYVHSLLFPLYTSDEIVSIENGHMTGSFDKTDILLSFLDKFNKKEFGNSITAIKENGYHYSLFMQNENRLMAFVNCSTEGYCIVVYMERIAYESTEGIWQVTGYQILENAAAENMKSQLEPYSDTTAEEITSFPQEDTAIKGTENAVIMYNVNEKENIVSLDEDDGKVVSNILNACDRHDDIKGDLFQYVIKINDISYMFDSNGNGMMDSAGKHLGITISENDMIVIRTLFELYNISLKESGETEPPLNDCSIAIGNLSLSLSESRQDILANLDAAGLDYSEGKPDYPNEAKYDFFYTAAGYLQIYFLDDNCVRIRLIDLESASSWNAQTARGLQPGDTYSQMTELYGDDFEAHAYAGKEIYTIYRYSAGDCICEFGIFGENSEDIYNIDIYLPSQSPIYEYGEEIPLR